MGAFGPSNRPGWVNVNMLGVHPGSRGQGYGTRLHAHLLARAAERFVMHGGATEAENQPMRRIFEKHGSRHDATQLSFRSSPLDRFHQSVHAARAVRKARKQRGSGCLQTDDMPG
nr:GNAT family N-acetyltransferase [Deinococcus humi]